MGCIGFDLVGSEYVVFICVKDLGGLYDYELIIKFIEMVKENYFDFIVDIFLYYGSDIGVVRRVGVDMKGVLIGSGVSVLYGMERIYLKGIENIFKLIYIYLIK